MKVLGLHHVNLNARDVEEAVAFYEKIGFATVPRPDFGFPGAWLQMGQHQLHLTYRTDPIIDTVQHFALQVEDLDACAAELEGLGVEIRRAKPVDGAGRQVFFKDPTGNLIELNHPAV